MIKNFMENFPISYIINQKKLMTQIYNYFYTIQKVITIKKKSIYPIILNKLIYIIIYINNTK